MPPAVSWRLVEETGEVYKMIKDKTQNDCSDALPAIPSPDNGLYVTKSRRSGEILTPHRAKQSPLQKLKATAEMTFGASVKANHVRFSADLDGQVQPRLSRLHHHMIQARVGREGRKETCVVQLGIYADMVIVDLDLPTHDYSYSEEVHMTTTEEESFTDPLPSPERSPERHRGNAFAEATLEPQTTVIQGHTERHKKPGARVVERQEKRGGYSPQALIRGKHRLTRHVRETDTEGSESVVGEFLAPKVKKLAGLPE